MSTETKGFPNLKLNNGETIPLIAYGLGTANYKRGDKNKLDQHIVNLTVQAIQTGFTHLDGAEAYGNEAELGAAIRAAGVPREALYVVTKATPRADRSLEENFAASLEKLGLDYVDLYLIHSPFQISDPPELAQKKWAEMEAIHASGRAKSIGVSNFLQEHLEPILATAQIVPAINQIEFHPYLQHVTPDGKWDLLKFCKEKGIALSGYAGLTALTAAAPGPVDGKYEELASKYNVTEGNVALRWTLDQGIVAITTSSREDRLRDYLEKLPSFNLSEDEVKDISELGRKKHYRAFWTKYFEKDDRR
ncbi:alpha-keto ester reductase-like protein [Coniella lustricola]|uniref:Alpha-keto ester reductase-like protein n=1 Tax=Coniella lustricola TaxID=2025994 RepID=A0A2T2ZUK9_9PEZI|nr:alpha-keto ester reductase-like protein [Coniella lustricola]